MSGKMLGTTNQSVRLSCCDKRRHSTCYDVGAVSKCTRGDDRISGVRLHIRHRPESDVDAHLPGFLRDVSGYLDE